MEPRDPQPSAPVGAGPDLEPCAPQGLSPRDLVDHGPAIRALLRTMVRDQDVDDLLQETWLRALSADSTRRSGLRAWLRGIASNLARDHWRRLGRRSRVEREVESSGSQAVEPAVDQTVAELEAWRVLGGAVEALAEPYRTTVVLRYFRGLSVAEIAAREELAEANVRQRIRRAVTTLRERLGERDRRQLALLVPSIPWPSAAEPVQSGWWLGGTLAAVGAVLLAWATGVFGLPDAAITPRVADAGLGAVGDQLPEAGLSPPAPVAGERSGPVASSSPVIARGRTVGADGSPVADVELFSWRSPDTPPDAAELPRVVSDRDGWFEVEVDAPGLLLGTREAASTLRGASLQRSSASAMVEVVVGPAVELTGRVVTFSGPVPDDVRLELHWEPLRRFPRVLSESFVPFGGVRAVDVRAPDGAFRVRGPRGPEASLHARAGFEHASVPAPSEDRAEVTIRLTPPTAVYTFAGTVRGPDERPLAGARVGVVGGPAADPTGPDGRYRIVVGSDGLAEHHRDLYAAAAGFRPHTATGVVQQVLLASGSQSFETELRLGSALAPLAGRVVDGEGSPLEGIVVRPWNPTLFGDGERDSVEDLAAGGDDGAEARTDPDGRFRLTGLDDRGYRLMCWRPGGRWPMVSREDWRPGAFAELVFDEVRALRSLSGIVRDHLGRPIAGARVGAVMNLAANPAHLVPDRRALVGFALSGPDGSFELPEVPRVGVRLQLDAPGHLPLAVLADQTERDHLPDLVLPARAGLHARDLGEDARWIRVEDREGRHLGLHRSDFHRRDDATLWPVVGGDVEVLECAPGDAWLVVLDVRHRQLARIPLLLHPGRVTVVRR